MRKKKKKNGSADTLTVWEAARKLGISRALAFKAVNAGSLPAFRIGRRWLVSRVGLERLVSGGNR